MFPIRETIVDSYNLIQWSNLPIFFSFQCTHSHISKQQKREWPIQKKWKKNTQIQYDKFTNNNCTKTNSYNTSKML